MPEVTYTGPADVKKFSAKDFASVGIEDQKQVVFTKDEPTHEVSEEAWAWLSSDESTEKAFFKLSDGSEDTGAVANAGEGDATADPAATEPGSDPVPADETGTAKAKAGRTGRGSSTSGSV